MIDPYMPACAVGLIVPLQMAVTVASSRGRANAWVGGCKSGARLRTARRHAKLGEKAGLCLIAVVTPIALISIGLSNVDQVMP